VAGKKREEVLIPEKHFAATPLLAKVEDRDEYGDH
jgi:hypothetical protein